MRLVRSLRGPLGFILLLLVLRALFLVAALDPSEERVFSFLSPALVEWPDGPVRSLFDREELYTPTAGEAVQLQLDIPLSLYRFMPYGAGSQMLSIASIPFVSVLGSNYLSFKLIPLLVTVLGGLFWFLTIRRWLGLVPAWIFGALYIFAPSALVRIGLVAKGDHAEAMAWIGLVLFLGTGAAQALDSSVRFLWSLAAGVAAGLGVFITYSTVPVLLGVAVAALLRTRVRPLSAWFTFVLGGVIGLVPWLLTVISTGGDALRVYGQPLGSVQFGAEAWERIQLLFNTGLFAGYDLPSGAVRSAAALLWLVAVALGWIRCIRFIRHPVSLLLLLGTLVHIAAFCLRAPDASPRYLVPGYPLFLASIAFLVMRSPQGGADAARPHPRQRTFRWGFVLAVLVVLLGLASQVRVVASSHFTALRRPLGVTDWPLLGEITGQKLSPGQIRQLPDAVRPHFWVGKGKRLGFLGEPEDWLEAAELAGLERDHLWKGVGYGLNESGKALEAPSHLQRLAHTDRTALRGGLAETAQYIFSGLADRAGPQAVKLLLTSYAKEDRPHLRFSLARVLGVLATHGIIPRETLDPMAGSFLDEEGRSFGAGYAFYRDIGGDGSIIGWKAPMGSWTRTVSDQIARGQGSPGAWRGVASAYEEDLRYRSPHWILGGAEGPRKLAKELNRIAKHVPAGGVKEFYRAAGRAAASAMRDPAVASGGLDRGSWDWTGVIPRPFHDAFREGLEAERY